MSEVIEINGKKWYSIKCAMRTVSYSRDYLTRLAREKKISATYFERQWFIDLKSLEAYSTVVSCEQQIRKKQLSDQRKRERGIRELLSEQNNSRVGKFKNLHSRALLLTAFVLCTGLSSGVLLHHTNLSTNAVSLLSSSVFQQASFVKHSQSASVSLAANQSSDSATSAVTFAGVSEASVEIRDLDEGKVGVLLLPDGQASSSVENYFSDPVIVWEREDGVQVVLRVDDNGNAVGKEIPFVQVPVHHEKL